METTSMLEAFGLELAEQAERRREVVALVADTVKTMAVHHLAARRPEQLINLGIMEQALVTAAAGLATTGKIPVVATYSVFLSMRTLEQLRTQICLPRLNVKFAAGLGGLSGGILGPTHQATEDMSVVRGIPNLAVLVPSDAVGMRQAVAAMLAWDGPVYLRVGNLCQVVHADGYQFAIGKANELLRLGDDATIIANGTMVAKALAAAETLRGEGVRVRVLEMPTLKPLDEAAVLDAARATGAVVTAEENNVLGGLGGAVAEVLGEGCPVPLRRVGIADRYGDTGPYAALQERYGLTAEAIAAAAKEVIARKR
ncbi:MAG: transketolase family protein [Chloroflexota bacterium]